MDSTNKRKNTCLTKYGVDNVAKFAKIQDKRKNTFNEKRNDIVFYQDPRINIIDGNALSIYRLNKDVADNWLNTYHPFKAPRGNILSIGLLKDDTIYCIMTFKRARNKKYFAELSRLWTLPTYYVTNGYDILSNAASELGIYNIVAYVNMSFENYKDYESIGMKYIRDIQRTKWWINHDDKMSDASRRQYKMNPHELLQQGWLPMYDCGTRVYEFT